MKKSFEPKTDQKRVFWLNNFSGKLAKYAAKYSLTADEVKDMVACALFFGYWVDYQNKNAEYSKKVTGFKNQMSQGVPSGAAAPVQPSAPDPGDIPPLVVPGIFSRAFSLAQRVKKHKDYTTGDGDDLGIEGPEQELPDLLTVKPVIQLVAGHAGQPTIIWDKGQMDGIDVYADRGAGTWALVGTANFPDFIDNAVLPAPGQTAYWQYRCIYRFGNEPVGQWSDIASIAVKG